MLATAKKNTITIFLYLFFFTKPILASSEESYYFDPSLIRGNALLTSAQQLIETKDVLSEGSYKIDLYVNNIFKGQSSIVLKKNAKGKIKACLTIEQIGLLGLKKQPDLNSQSCYFSSEIDKNITDTFKPSELKLNFSIPQAMLINKNSQFLHQDSLDDGETMLFVNYNLNQYHVSYKNNMEDIDSTYIDMKTGINLGLWGYRQDSHYSYTSANNNSKWVTTRRYLQRAFYSINSQLLIGEGFTSGRFLSGLGFKGVQLSSDDRMLPNNARGYAPKIQGIANSNAKVTVWQNQNLIYETTVSPGPFVIDDLYSTNYAGDIRVEITEADGSKNTFIVPFSSVPESVRPGYSKYSATVGKTRFVGDQDLFSEFIFQHGLTNSITLNLANQLAKGYQAGTIGGVYTTRFGAFSVNATFSYAKLPENTQETGWKYHASYSKTFQPTDTSITLSSYHYSTNGFRSLEDTLNANYLAKQNNSNWQDHILRQRSRFDITINQNLNDYGNLGLSASREDYHNNNGKNDQLQLTWATAFNNGVSVNLSVARMSNSLASDWYYQGDYSSQAKSQIYSSIGISVPLGRDIYAPNLSFSASKTKDHSNYQTNISGVMDIDEQPINYGLGYVAENQISQGMLSASLQTQLPYTNLRATTSRNENYWQVSGGVQGSLVAHKGGVTLGSYLADSFALVDASGAKGAKVSNRSNIVVDRFGYALIPSLVPYQYNSILLSSDGIDSKVEISSPEKRVAPYAGAMVRVKYKTTFGQPLLITLLTKNNFVVPMGSQAIDENGAVVGMVGQGNQLYLRAENKQAKLNIKWGDAPDEQCSLQYQIDENDTSPLISLASICH